jgi:hypothetical protein
MERMSTTQMQQLEAYYKLVEKVRGISDTDNMKYVRKKFGISLTKTYIPVLKSRLNKGKVQ